MASAVDSVRIFISSPGDVAEERALARRVIERLGGEFAARAVLEPIFWEHEPLRATAAWHEQILSPREADIVICILWSRLGTRQPAEIRRQDGSRYDSGTEYEFEEAWRSYQERGQPDLLVYRKTREPRVSLRDRAELMQRVEQKEALDRFIDTWFQDREEGTLIAAFHPFDSSDDFEELFEVHLRKLLEQRLPRAGAGGEPRIRIWTEGSPFRGLRSFEFGHAAVFFGRTRATSEVLEALRTQAARGRPFVLVLGMSGCGKSSLVRAGVLPLLTQPGVIEGVGLWRRAVMRPSDAAGDPFAGLATALLREQALPELGADGTGVGELARLLRESPEAAFALLKGGLSQAASELARSEGLERQPQARLALVVDQLEELFSSAGAAERERFTEALRALVESGRVWVLATLRSDFYPRMSELPALVELKEGSGQYDLLPPTAAEIGQMIRRPAQLAGLGFEEREATGERLDDTLRDAAARNPEALPLLQFTLEELYAARSDGELTFAAYEELGGVGGALAQRAEAAFGGLEAEVRAALPSVLSRLVTVGGDASDGATRQRAALEEFPEAGAERALVEGFVEARLFVTDRDERGRAVVSVAHEALLEHWPRLAEWLAHNRELLRMRERLDAAAEQWEAEGRPASYLLASAQRLAEAEELEGAEGIELPAREHAFLQASLARGRRARWLKRAAVAALAVLTVLAAAGAWIADSKRQEAEVARGESEAVTGFLGDMLASVDPDELGRDVLVKDVLDQASKKIDDLADQPLIQARLMHTMGKVYDSLGLYDEARPLMEKGLAIREGTLGTQDPLVAQSLNDLGNLRQKAGDYEAARPLLERALAARERVFGPDHQSVADTLNSLANVDLEEADYEAARPLYERAIAIWEEKLGPEHSRLGNALNGLALVLSKIGDHEAARPLFERVLAIWEKELGPEHRRVAIPLNNLGLLLRDIGDFEGAKSLYERALAIEEKALGPEHPEVASTLENLAILDATTGDLEAARPLFERGLRIREIALGPEHPDSARMVVNLGILHAQMGDYEGALPYFERGAAITEKTLGPEHPSLANALNNLATLYGEMGDLEAARPLVERALAIREKALGPEHPTVATSLQDLAEVLAKSGELEAARPLFERALAIREKVQGPEHSDVATTLIRFADLLRRAGDHEEAREMLERSLAINEKALGPDHPEVAASLDGLARVLRELGEGEESERLFERALEIRQEKLGPDHPYVAETLEGYAALLRQVDRRAEATELEARAQAIRRRGS